MKKATMNIDISSICYYIIPILIMYWFWYYIVFSSVRSRRHGPDEDEVFGSIFCTFLTSYIYFIWMDGVITFSF